MFGIPTLLVTCYVIWNAVDNPFRSSIQYCNTTYVTLIRDAVDNPYRLHVNPGSWYLPRELGTVIICHVTICTINTQAAGT